MKKRCIRKHYKLLCPIKHAIDGACITADKLLDDLLLRELASLESMAKGQGGLQEWSDLNAVLGISETMARNGIGPEVLPFCAALQADLMVSARRFEATHKMGMTAKGIQAARDVIEYHTLQRKSIPRSEYEQMIAKTLKRIRSKAPEVLDLSEC